MKITSIQSLIIKLLSNKLNLEDVDVNENFFDLGLNSIELSQLCSEISLAINKNLNILLFYEFPTISLLAQEIYNYTRDITSETK